MVLQHDPVHLTVHATLNPEGAQNPPIHHSLPAHGLLTPLLLLALHQLMGVNWSPEPVSLLIWTLPEHKVLLITKDNLLLKKVNWLLNEPLAGSQPFGFVCL